MAKSSSKSSNVYRFFEFQKLSFKGILYLNILYALPPITYSKQNLKFQTKETSHL